MLGHGAVARLLIVAGADVNFEDPMHKRSVLHEATLGGHEQLVTDLLISGANANCLNDVDGGSLLHVAAGRGFDGIVSTLLLRGADKDALDHGGETALIWASNHGRLAVVTTLLVAGADLSVRGIYSHTALDYALKQGHGDVVETIIGHGVDVNAGNDDGFTALHIAAQFDRASAADSLIEAGADVELKKVNGCTTLASSAYFSSCKAMLTLLQHGAKVDVRNKAGDFPLHQACWGRSEGLEAAVDMLLRSGADETALNNNGQSPAELLDMERDENVVYPSTEDEIEWTRLLLSRAPADRAWRCRGWLVILRTRDSKAKAGERSADGHGADGGEGGGSEVTTSESVAVVGHGGPRKPGNGMGGELDAEGRGGIMDGSAGPLGFEMEGAMGTASNDGCVGGAEVGEESLRLEALPLLGLGLEGVFRTVVGFL